MHIWLQNHIWKNKRMALCIAHEELQGSWKVTGLPTKKFLENLLIIILYFM